MAYTKLHKAICDDEKLAELVDEDPMIGVVWLYLLGAAPPWGRFPASIRRLKARACPLLESITTQKLATIVDRLVEVRMVQRYTCDWTETECLALRQYSKHNSAGRQYHRMGKPEFAPPPDWIPPTDLIAYLGMVVDGKYSSKNTVTECEKFGVNTALLLGSSPREHSQGVVPGSSPKEASQGIVPGSSPREQENGATELPGPSQRRSQGALPGSSPSGVVLDLDGDVDGDGGTTRDDDGDVSARARAREGHARCASPSQNDEPADSDPLAPFIELNGPKPNRKHKEDRDDWTLALRVWKAGHCGVDAGGMTTPEVPYQGDAE